MADNVAITSGTGTTISTDDVGGGVQVQRVKVQYGADGFATDVSSATPLPATIADGGDVTIGAKADNKSTATDTTPVSAMSVWKQISASVQAIASSIAGTLTVATHAVTQSGTWTVQPGNTANTTAWKVDGSAVTQPVSIATAPVLVAGTAVIGKVGIDQTTPGTTNLVALAANQSVNVAQINGVVPLMGTGNTGTGSHRVTIATDQSALAAWGLGATGSAVPSGAQYEAGVAKTALPSAATDGNLTGAMFDKFGRQVVNVATIRDLVGTQTTTISASTSETTIVTAGGAGVFNDLVMLIISNTSASTNTRIDFRDATAGSVLFSIQSNGGQPPVGFALPVPIPQTTAANNWTAQCATSTTDVRIYAVYAKNK